MKEYAEQPAFEDGSEIPSYCDFFCAFGDFPPPETCGGCRTMSAVWCTKLGRLVHKNMPCEWTKEYPMSTKTWTRVDAKTGKPYTPPEVTE